MPGGMRLSFDAQEKCRQSRKYTRQVLLWCFHLLRLSQRRRSPRGQQQARRVLHQQSPVRPQPQLLATLAAALASPRPRWRPRQRAPRRRPRPRERLRDHTGGRAGDLPRLRGRTGSVERWKRCVLSQRENH